MERSLSTYIEHIKRSSVGTRNLFISAHRSFAGLEELITSNPNEEHVYDTIQAWINGLHRNPSTVRLYFSRIKQYLYYRGIRLHPLDIRQTLKFPILYEEELHPLSIGEFCRVLEACDPQRRVMYLAQASSGMRIGEIIQLRRKHVNTEAERIMVKLPAALTKRKRGRTTFFSSETADLLLPRLKELEGPDLIFASSPSRKLSLERENRYMSRILGEIGLDERYETNGRHKITTHSFRAYFITRVSRRDPNLAKYFAGQKGYMLQYDRLTDEEKLDYYMEFEPDLLIRDRTEVKRRIKKPAAIRKVDALEKSNSELMARLRKLEDAVMDMGGWGVSPREERRDSES